MTVCTKIQHAVFLGSKSLGLNVLKCLFLESTNIKWTIIHPNDASDARSNLNEFNAFAKERDLDILVAASSSAAKEMLANFQPDIGFVCGWYWLFDSETLSRVTNGLWGIHNSLLPKYRGGSPLVWSILNGDEFVGSTVFRISDGTDDGEILCQVEVRLEPSHNISDALFAIERKLIEELPEKWKSLISNQVRLIEQDNSQATYCGQRTESDGLIDWKMGATDVHNFVRAQSSPYPGAYTYLEDMELRILRTQVFNGIFFGTPGQVLRRNKQSVLVACGKNSAIELLNIRVKTKNHEENPARVIKSIKDRLASIPTLSWMASSSMID